VSSTPEEWAEKLGKYELMAFAAEKRLKVEKLRRLLKVLDACGLGFAPHPDGERISVRIDRPVA
jgi:hypothetical protein